jgi:hypothetical protein
MEVVVAVLAVVVAVATDCAGNGGDAVKEIVNNPGDN